MFAGYRTDELRSPAAEMLRILRAAGCDTTKENDLQMGMVACNAALLVCKSAERPFHPARKSRTGRNEPCPCGSGRKYKKCCLDSDRPLSADNDRSASLKFGPEILPRLWDEDAIVEDCALLGRIMHRDQAFANVGFSPEKIAAFMDRVFEQGPSPFGDADQDEETCQQAIDHLAVRYIRESGDSRTTRGIKDKFLAAARRAQSQDEARALATGICLALRADATKDPADDLIGIILFRKALFAAARPIQIVNKIFGQLGGDEDEIRRLIEANDPSIRAKIKSAMDELSASELDALQASYERRHKNLWDTIAADEFPVPMPCATQIALLGRVVSAASNETSSHNDLSVTLEAFCDALIEDDYALYGQMLDRWLKQCGGQPDRVIDAVNFMRELCGVRLLEDLAPSLLVRSLRTMQLVPFDEEEKDLIDSYRDVDRKMEFIARYSSWLKSKGYPGMANRLLMSWESCDTPPGDLRKSSVG